MRSTHSLKLKKDSYDIKMSQLNPPNYFNAAKIMDSKKPPFSPLNLIKFLI